MLTGMVPAIYERWWRPALGRLAKGVLGPSMAEERRVARLLLGLVPGDGVLDVACGPGNFTRDFGRVVGPAGLAIGIDASPTMLAKAARDTPAAEYPSVGYVRGDAMALPFRDAGFDAVCCFAALHLFADPFVALDHMTRVLTPGGRIALMTSCRLRSSPLRTVDGGVGARGGIRMFERAEIVDALHGAGLPRCAPGVSGPHADRRRAARVGRWPRLRNPDPRASPGSSTRGRSRSASTRACSRRSCASGRGCSSFGEVWNLRESRARMYFELRDGDGAVPCAMWRDALRARSASPPAPSSTAPQVVVAGGPDYYPGSRTSSPSFSFHVTGPAHRRRGRPAGPARGAAPGAGRTRASSSRRSACPGPALPRTIGVVTGEGGKARDDVLAGLRRRGWAGRLVWAFTPVQDRHAAPAITRALQDLAAVGEVDVIVVARGGGSLADLFAFCDETLCRTVALLPVPVIASVGHHTDRTLIDDVAAVSCSTPTPRRGVRRPAALRRGAGRPARDARTGSSTTAAAPCSTAPGG